MLETSGLIDGGDDDVAENQEADDRRNHKKGNLAEAAVEASTQNAGDFIGSTERAAHDGKFRGGDGHAEQTDKEGIESLCISQGRDGTCRQPTGEKCIYISTDLYDAPAHKYGKEVMENGAHVFGLMGEREF